MTKPKQPKPISTTNNNQDAKQNTLKHFAHKKAMRLAQLELGLMQDCIMQLKSRDALKNPDNHQHTLDILRQCLRNYSDQLRKMKEVK